MWELRAGRPGRVAMATGGPLPGRGVRGAQGLPGAAWLARRRRRAGERAGAALRGRGSHSGTGTGTGAERGAGKRRPRSVRGGRGGEAPVSPSRWFPAARPPRCHFVPYCREVPC